MPEVGSTKEVLANAMKQLMQSQPFSKISIGEICEACDMNRKSFYYHFEDKYDLVNWIFDTEFVAALHLRNFDNGWDVIEAVFAYFYENRRFYRNALEVRGQNSFRDHFQTFLQAIVGMQLQETFEREEESAFFTEFFSDAVVVSVEKWLCQSPCRPPEEYAALMRRAVEGLVRRMTLDEEAE